MSIADEALGRLGQLNENRIMEVLASIREPPLREAVTRLIAQAIDARQHLTQIDLKPFEASHHELEGMAIWNALATQFGDALNRVVGLLDFLGTVVPAPADTPLNDEDFNLAFAEHDAPLTTGAYEPRRDNAIAQIDGILPSPVQRPPAPAASSNLERLQNSCYVICSMVRDEIARFGARIRQAAVVMDRWNLLADLQETRHKLTKGVDALILGICTSFAAVRRDEVIPGFHTELASALELRSLIFELREGIQNVRRRLDTLPQSQWLPAAAEAYDAMERFVFGPAFGWLRSLDKRAVIEQRNGLHELVNASPPHPRRLLEAIEGIVRYLEALEVINRREILVEHDRQVLQSAADHLDRALSIRGPASRRELAAAIAALAAANGRDEELDELVGSALDPSADVDPRALYARVLTVLTGM